jgi:hypothetical protein
VSDRSGTPQAGNPAEEYSGERDPAAFEPGHAQTFSQFTHYTRSSHHSRQFGQAIV